MIQTVADIMTPVEKIRLIDSFATVKDAMQMMRDHDTKVLIVDKKAPSDAYGIITYKNILKAIVAEEGDVDLLNVYDVMTKPAIQVSKELGLLNLARMMVQQNIKRVLVIDHNELEGIVTMDDFIELLMKSTL